MCFLNESDFASQGWSADPKYRCCFLLITARENQAMSDKDAIDLGDRFTIRRTRMLVEDALAEFKQLPI